jgi:tRNA threonylcarbamoyladenosine biosynthesis protein TsaB
VVSSEVRPYPLLALDTSGAPAAAVLTGPGHVAAQLTSPHASAHVEELAPIVQQLLTSTGLGVSNLAGIAAGTGPAPYTGLKIGLVTARALAYPDLPVWGVSSLDAVAAQAAGDLALGPGATVLATGDAKRHEVYWALYRVGPDPAGTGECWQALELVSGPNVGFAEDAPSADVIAGAGAALYPDQLPLTPGAPTQVSPAWLGAVAAYRAAAGLPTPGEPLYLRRPDAKVPGPRKRATGTRPAPKRQ